MFQVRGGDPDLYTLGYVLYGLGQNDLGVIVLLRKSSNINQKVFFNVYHREARTCRRADSSQMSSFVGQCSHPVLMIFRAVTILPACSSTQAAAIHPGACLGFDFTKDSKSIRARLMSLQNQHQLKYRVRRPSRTYPISASVFSCTLARSVK